MNEFELRLECLRLVLEHKVYEAPPETIIKEAKLFFNFVWRGWPPQ